MKKVLLLVVLLIASVSRASDQGGLPPVIKPHGVTPPVTTV